MVVQWDDGSPAEQRDGIRIRRVPASGDLVVWILGPIVGVYTHYSDGRSHPCLGDACTLCPSVRRRMGYLPGRVCDHDPAKNSWRKTNIVLELTEGARVAIEQLEPYVGLVVSLHRAKRGQANSPVVVSVHAEQTDKQPESFDVRAILERVWGLRQTKADRPDVIRGPWRKQA